MKLIPPVLALILAVMAAVPARAEEDAFEFYEEEAQVVTASRRVEPAWKAPVAVDVVTGDDIRAYGYREVWDALRFRAGMDVVEGRSLDGNRALVSARGFGSEFVAEMQVLVDGRSVYSPLLGGVYWQSLPVQLGDIERIEIVRGPNAALYGSNAGLGVVNIITRRPGNAPSAAATVHGGSREQWRAAASGEAASPRAGLRLSAVTRFDQGHASSRGDDDASDFLRLSKVNARGRWTPADGLGLEFLGGGSWMSAGLPGMTPDAEAHQQQNFQTVRATKDLGADSAVEASLSRGEAELRSSPVYAGDVRIRTYQYDADLLHRFAWADGRMKSSWGAGFRQSGADSVQVFGADPRHENRLVRGFTQHAFDLTEEVTLAGGLSLEHTGTSGTHEAWQAALIATPLEEHTFRVGYAFAPTVPPLTEKFGHYALAPGRTYLGNPAFAPEHLASWEAGWNARLLGGRVRPSVALYYMTLSDYGSSESLPSGDLTTRNSDRAISRGAEASLDVAPARWLSAFANYTFESITNVKGRSATGYDPARTTPVHKFNAGGRVSLPRAVTLSAILGYKDAYQANSASRGRTAPVPRHFRLDLRAAWAPRPGWEVFIAGRELLQPAFTEYVDRTATPRSVRAGVEARFAP